MAKDFRVLDSSRNNYANLIADLPDGLAGAGILAIYSGTPPAENDSPLAGNTLLVQIPLQDPAFDSPGSGGTVTLQGTPQGTAVAAGVATFYRVYSSADGSTITDPGNSQFQGTVGDTSDHDLQLTNTTIAINDEVTINSLTITVERSLAD